MVIQSAYAVRTTADGGLEDMNVILIPNWSCNLHGDFRDFCNRCKIPDELYDLRECQTMPLGKARILQHTLQFFKN